MDASTKNFGQLIEDLESEEKTPLVLLTDINLLQWLYKVHTNKELRNTNQIIDLDFQNRIYEYLKTNYKKELNNLLTDENSPEVEVYLFISQVPKWAMKFSNEDLDLLRENNIYVFTTSNKYYEDRVTLHLVGLELWNMGVSSITCKLDTFIKPFLVIWQTFYPDYQPHFINILAKNFSIKDYQASITKCLIDRRFEDYMNILNIPLRKF